MKNSPSPSLDRAVERARWLAELATALDHATRLTVALCDTSAGGSESVVLRGRIVTLRDEVDSIRKRRRPDAEQSHPQWIY